MLKSSFADPTKLKNNPHNKRALAFVKDLNKKKLKLREFSNY